MRFFLSVRGQCSPGLWKELAKEVLASKALLEAFLEAASALPFISDHRTQELVFEALYRLWKVGNGRASTSFWYLLEQDSKVYDVRRNLHVKSRFSFSFFQVRFTIWQTGVEQDSLIDWLQGSMCFFLSNGTVVCRSTYKPYYLSPTVRISAPTHG